MRRTSTLVLTLELARASEAGDPFAFAWRTTEYVRRLPDGVVRAGHLTWAGDLQEDLLAIARTPPSAEAMARLGDGLREFLLSLGWAEDETQIRVAVAEGQPIRLTLKLAAAELFALPWELLAVGEDRRRLGNLPGMDLRYAWPGQAATPGDAHGSRLLYAWSDAGGPVPRHDPVLQAAFAAAAMPWDPVADVLPRASYAALARRLAEASQSAQPYTALHLLAHGVPGPGGGVCLALDESMVDGPTLRELLSNYASQLRLVVICACQSSDPGRPDSHLGSLALGAHQAGVADVIASRLPLSVRGSILLTQVLYEAMLAASPPAALGEAIGQARRELLHSARPGDATSLQRYTRDSDDRPFTFRPYRGLLSFGPSDARFFFGRESERDEIIAELDQLLASGAPRFQIIEGASGTGKSSVALAGVVPALARRGWAWGRMVPGSDPNAALDAALAARPPDIALFLLVVDQLEEIFTALPADKDGQAIAQAFVRRLWSLAHAPRPAIAVLSTLRSDFKGRCGDLVLDDSCRMDQLFAGARRQHHVFIPQMDTAQLRACIEKPALAVGLHLPADLLDRLLDAVGAEPGALPLLEHTLDLLWERREGGTLTGEAYVALGGVGGALTTHADRVLSGFDANQQNVARRLLVRLVAARPDSALDTRRRLPIADLMPADPEGAVALDVVLETLVRARLLVRATDAAPTVEIAHEALIRRWAHLREWVALDREKLAAIDEIERWATQWRAYPESLLSGRKLGYAAQISERYPGDLSADGRALIAASEEAERKATSARRRKLAASLAIGVVVLMAFAVLSLLAQSRKREAQAQAATARDQARMSAAREAEDDPTTVAMLLREVERPLETRGWLRLARATAAQARAVAVMRGAEGPVVWARFSPDERTVVTASSGGVAARWPTDGIGAPGTLAREEWPIIAAALSPDGRHLLTAANLWVSQRSVSDPHADAIIYDSSLGVVGSARYSADGRRVVAAQERAVVVWDAATGRQVATFWDHAGTVRDVAISPDGARVLSASDDGTARIWTVDGSRPTVVLAHNGPVRAARLSPDGTRALTVDAAGQALLWSGAELARILPGSSEPVTSALFSPQGDTLLVVMRDGALLCWPPDGSGPARELREQGAAVLDTAFSPDGRRLLIGGEDGVGWLLWTDGGAAPVRLGAHQGAINTVAFSSSGQLALTGSQDGSTRIWSLADLPAPSPPPPTALRAASYTADGALALAVSEDVARIWRVAAPDRPLLLRGVDEGPIQDAQLSPDGRSALILDAEGWPTLWSLDPQALIAGTYHILRDSATPVALAAFAPDGSAVFTVSEDGSARRWRTHEEREPTQLRGLSGRPSVARVSPDGSRLLLASEDGLALVQRADGAGTAALLRGHTGPIRDANFSADGYKVVTASEDATARVWVLPDLESSSPLDPDYTPQDPLVLRGHEGYVLSAAFSPDGSRVLTASDDHSTRVWDLDTGAAIQTLAGQSATGPETSGLAALVESLWRVTRACLPEDERAARLGERGPDADANAAACRDRILHDAETQF